MNNEFGLINLWTEGDAVTRFVALLLLAMSLASWIVIILKSLNFFTAQKQAERIEAFWHSPNVAGGVQALGDEEGNPFSTLVLRGQEAMAHLKTGTLRDGVALSGYVLGASGRRYLIVSLVNHDQATNARAFNDALITWLAEQ